MHADLSLSPPSVTRSTSRSGLVHFSHPVVVTTVAQPVHDAVVKTNATCKPAIMRFWSFLG